MLLAPPLSIYVRYNNYEQNSREPSQWQGLETMPVEEQD